MGATGNNLQECMQTSRIPLIHVENQTNKSLKWNFNPN